jgi:hypothetical protein
MRFFQKVKIGQINIVDFINVLLHDDFHFWFWGGNRQAYHRIRILREEGRNRGGGGGGGRGGDLLVRKNYGDGQVAEDVMQEERWFNIVEIESDRRRERRKSGGGGVACSITVLRVNAKRIHVFESLKLQKFSVLRSQIVHTTWLFYYFFFKKK